MSYFALEPNISLESKLTERVKDFYSFSKSSGIYSLWLRSYNEYFKAITTHRGIIPDTGEAGELKALYINHYRNLLQHLLTLITSQRPSFDARAANTDASSMGQAILANSLLDYYMREKKLDRDFITATEYCLFSGKGFIKVEWDQYAGNVFDVMPGKSDSDKVIYEGDVTVSVHTPWNCIRDISAKNSAMDWCIIRYFPNKYELSAIYPESKDEIEKITPNFQDRLTDMLYVTSGSSNAMTTFTDHIPAYKFFHRKTKALPMGRYAHFVEGKLLMESGLPYKHFPISEMSPAETEGSIHGYTPGFDILPLQDGINTLYSSIMTNQSNYGTQLILSPKNSGINYRQLAEGLSVIEYDPAVGPPSGFNVLQTSPEVFKFVSLLQQQQELVSGVNATVRGQAPEGVVAGVSLALLSSQALSFAQNLQRSFVAIVEDVGTQIISVLQQYAKTERVAAITGKDNKYLLQKFTAEDISDIDRVLVDLGNPLSRTTAGKVSMADAFLKSGFVQDPDQYIQVVTTGRLEPVYKVKQAELILIQDENEAMMNGISPQVIITDRHKQHILEHKVILASVEARQNPELMKVCLAHIQEHINMLQGLTASNPDLLAALDEQAAIGNPNPPPPQGQASAQGQAKVLQAQPTPPGVRAIEQPKNPLTKQPIKTT